jgi:3-phenylpropionate/trans-cinnamate dioxygenase ferredoxin component
VRDARADDVEGRAAQGEGHAAPRGPRRARRAGARIAELVDVCPVEELPPGTLKIVRTPTLDVGVYNCGGDLLAIEDRCSHDDGPLAEGDWDEDRCVVVCPRHGANFDLRTGRALTLPAYEPVDVYPVRVEDGVVKVELP